MLSWSIKEKNHKFNCINIINISTLKKFIKNVKMTIGSFAFLDKQLYPEDMKSARRSIRKIM